MTAPLPAVSHGSCLEQAIRVLQEKFAPAVGIVDAAGILARLVTSETTGELIMVNSAMPKGTRFGPWSRPAGT